MNLPKAIKTENNKLFVLNFFSALDDLNFPFKFYIW